MNLYCLHQIIVFLFNYTVWYTEMVSDRYCTFKLKWGWFIPVNVGLHFVGLLTKDWLSGIAMERC